MSEQFGVNVWWTIPEFVRQDGDTVRALVTKYGFEPKDMPTVTRQEEVSRAAHSFHDRRHMENRRVTERALNNGRHVTYGILDLVQTSSEEVAYKQNTTIRLCKDDGRVTAEGALAIEFEKALAIYAGAVIDKDIRVLFRNIIKLCKGVPLRKTGGIYFVPDRYASIIESAKNLIAELGVGARLYVQRLQNGVTERAIVWEAVVANIDGEIEKTLNQVERIEKRASALTDHEERLNELEAMAGIYRDILGQEARYEDVAEKLADAERKVAEKLASLQQTGTVAAPVATPASTPAPTASATSVALAAPTSAIPAAAVPAKVAKRVSSDFVEAAVVILKATGASMSPTQIARAVRGTGVEVPQAVAVVVWRAAKAGLLVKSGYGLYSAA